MSSVRSDRTILLDGRAIPVDVLRHPRARGYRLRMERDGSRLKLSMPSRGSVAKALDWARQQQEWLRIQSDKAVQAIALEDGARFPLEGGQVTIIWNERAPRTPTLEGERLLVGGPRDAAGRRVLRWLRARALEVLTRETYEIAAREGLAVASVAIGDARSRWGSCTSGGAIRYSWRLILVPPGVRRSTVAHEVAHLLHMDHSPAFHTAHQRLLREDPAPARAWLRRHGAELHAYR